MMFIHVGKKDRGIAMTLTTQLYITWTGAKTSLDLWFDVVPRVGLTVHRSRTLVVKQNLAEKEDSNANQKPAEIIANDPTNLKS